MALGGMQDEMQGRRAGFGWRVARAFLQRREASIMLVGTGLFVYFSLASSAFFTGDAIRTMGDYVAPIALITCGEVMLLICGEIDLSVGRCFALAPAVMWLASAGSPDGAGLPVVVGLILGLLACVAVGLVNGIVTTFLRVPSFITTLGMLFFLNGVILHALKGSQQLMPGGGTFKNIAGKYVPHFLFNAEFFWAVAAVVVIQLVLTKTRWGLHTVATGGNLIGASESGVNVRTIKIGNFVLTSLLGGFAGILDSVRITSIYPLQGGPEVMFLAVSAAVIGGTSLLGGSGTIIGGFLGVCVLGILNIGFIILGVSAYDFDLIIGLAIIIAMVLNIQAQRLKNVEGLQ